MSYKKIKLPLSRLAPADTAIKIDSLIESLTDNPNVPEPQPSLPVMSARAQSIRDQQSVVSGLLTDLRVARGQLRELNQLAKDDLGRLMRHVEAECDGEANKLLSTGFKLVKEPTRRGALPPVEELRVQRSEESGRLDLQWKPVPGALCYLPEHGDSPDGPWITMDPTSRAACSMSGLEPGTKHWLRVRAVGTAGPGPWSGAISRMAA